MRQPKVLFHIGNYTSCNEMFVIIDKMLKAYSVKIYVVVEDEKISRYVRDNFKNRDINLIDFYGVKDEPRGHRFKNKKCKKIKWSGCTVKFKELVYCLPIWDWHRQQSLSRLIQERVEQCRDIVSKIKPDTLVVRGDRHLGNHWEGALLKVCGEENVRRVIVPVATAGIEGLFHMRRKNEGLLVNKASKLHSEFTSQIAQDPESGKYLLYKKAYILRALKQNGVLSANPWVMGGGNSDLVLLEGQAAYDRYISEGCLSGKMIVTGHGSNDQLYENYSNRSALRIILHEKYSLDLNKKLVVVALPQLAEHKLMSWEQHWSEIRFICKTMMRTGGNILISLHPRMDPEKYSFITEEYGIPVAKDRLMKILPIADIYACTFSSTLEWSILCGIPTIVFDFYNLGFRLYDDIASLTVVTEKDALPSHLNSLLHNQVKYDFVKRLTQKDSIQFGILDGSCRERIIEQIL